MSKVPALCQATGFVIENSALRTGAPAGTGPAATAAAAHP